MKYMSTYLFSYFRGCVRKVFENVISILFKGLQHIDHSIGYIKVRDCFDKRAYFFRVQKSVI